MTPISGGHSDVVMSCKLCNLSTWMLSVRVGIVNNFALCDHVTWPTRLLLQFYFIFLVSRVCQAFMWRFVVALFNHVTSDGFINDNLLLTKTSLVTWMHTDNDNEKHKLAKIATYWR